MKTTGTAFNVDFKDMQNVDDANALLIKAFGEVIQKAFTDGQASGEDLVGVELKHPSMTRGPIYVPWTNKEKLSSEKILNTVEQIHQSNQDVSFDGRMQVKITRIQAPKKGKGYEHWCREHRVHWTRWFDKHCGHGGCFIKVKNKDELCCARALVVAKAHVDKDPRYKDIAKGDIIRWKIQQKLAKELMAKAGLANHQGGCGLGELEMLQAALAPDYQIKVFDKHYNDMITFEGPAAPKVLHLYFHDGHYDVLSKVAAMFNSSHWCDDCNQHYE